MITGYRKNIFQSDDVKSVVVNYTDGVPTNDAGGKVSVGGWVSFQAFAGWDATRLLQAYMEKETGIYVSQDTLAKNMAGIRLESDAGYGTCDTEVVITLRDGTVITDSSEGFVLDAQDIETVLSW